MDIIPQVGSRTSYRKSSAQAYLKVVTILVILLNSSPLNLYQLLKMISFPFSGRGSQLSMTSNFLCDRVNS